VRGGGADVRYVAQTGFDYGPFDWAAHDETCAQYEQTRIGLRPELAAGALGAGRHAEGWLAFVVPTSAAHIWLDYKTYTGDAIFSVKIY
jgi:hypothetical protein